MTEHTDEIMGGTELQNIIDALNRRSSATPVKTSGGIYPTDIVPIITSASVLLNEMVGLPYTGTMLVLNIVLFIWGIRVKGLAYVLRSLGTMIALGLLLDLSIPALSLITPSSDVTAMIWGSLLTGAGDGLIVSADTSTGGKDYNHFKLLSFTDEYRGHIFEIFHGITLPFF